jgi:hypothetical protein
MVKALGPQATFDATFFTFASHCTRLAAFEHVHHCRVLRPQYKVTIAVQRSS